MCSCIHIPYNIGDVAQIVYTGDPDIVRYLYILVTPFAVQALNRLSKDLDMIRSGSQLREWIDEVLVAYQKEFSEAVQDETEKTTKDRVRLNFEAVSVSDSYLELNHVPICFVWC